MSQPAESPSRAARLLAAHVVLTAVCVGVYAAGISLAVSVASFLLIGVSTAVAMVVGPRLNASPERVAWRLMLLVCFLFAIGPSVRPWVEHAGNALVALPDVFLIPGYVIAIAALLRVMRLRGARDAEAVLDVVVVVVGAMLLSVSYVVAPAITHSQLPVSQALLASVYPVLDVVLLALLAMLVFTARDRNPAVLLLGAAIVIMLVGDVRYNWLARDGVLFASPSYDIPYLVSFGLLGAAALHPSMRQLTTGRNQPVQAWSVLRLAVIVPALLVPALLILPDANLPLWTRWLQGIGSAVLVAVLLVRAGRAVQEQSRSRRVFQHMASHDSLTGLANRVALNERLESLIASGTDVTVLFIDLDGFKLVNDSWGHAVGDELLVQVAERMATSLPDDVVLCRAGGDEFLVVAPTRNHDRDGLVLAGFVITELSQPFQLSVGEVVVTPSIGVATSSDRHLGGGEPDTAQTLVRDADTAMYRAKDAGRRRAVAYDPTMGEHVRRRVALDRELRHAVSAGDIDVAYQPIVKLATGRLVGFEALARWNRPDGPCPPDQFIPVAEENGLILRLGEIVLAQSLDQLCRWRRATPLDIGVNINVSVRQLQDPRFVHQVLAALSSRDLPTSVLRLEVTESTLVGKDATANQSLSDLEVAGVSVSVDDFGTGYSSLSYLSRLRVHEVKIDRSFVSGITTRPHDHAIVRATAAMAHAMQLGVVAEGIETPEQRDALVALGVERGQGWFFGRPMPAAQALELVSAQWQDAAPPGPAH
ncbi:MAG TPA: EAL domain-containing protein [Actinomycetales bacterium]|nr:EAL domain-containing protein [Actinomycetales bacterium]